MSGKGSQPPGKPLVMPKNAKLVKEQQTYATAQRRIKREMTPEEKRQFANQKRKARAEKKAIESKFDPDFLASIDTQDVSRIDAKALYEDIDIEMKEVRTHTHPLPGELETIEHKLSELKKKRANSNSAGAYMQDGATPSATQEMLFTLSPSSIHGKSFTLAALAGCSNPFAYLSTDCRVKQMIVCSTSPEYVPIKNAYDIIEPYTFYPEHQRKYSPSEWRRSLMDSGCKDPTEMDIEHPVKGIVSSLQVTRQVMIHALFSRGEQGEVYFKSYAFACFYPRDAPVPNSVPLPSKPKQLRVNKD